MQIHESYHNRVWREPDEIDIEALREARRTPAPAPQPEAEAPAPFWTAAPATPGVLQELPPAPVQAPPPPPPPPAPYVGEKPVDAAWLNEREQALRAVRADYEAARAAAQANVGGTGWTDAVMVTDESGSTHSASGRPTVFVPDSNAPPQVIGWDEGGPVYAAVTGRTLEFDDEAFAAHYRAQGGAALQNLARLYDTDAGTLLARHPEMWQIATQDHAINAGPAPAGRAMGDPGQLGMLDLYLADPQIAELIDTYGGKAAPAVSGLAPEQARIYGEQRYEQLTKLGTAMQAVRDDYAAQLANAQAHGGPGWVTTTYEITYADEGNVWHTGEYATRSDFSVDAFTDWYIAQDGVANRAFASFYGRSHAEYATDESGVRFVSRVTFDNPSWEMGGPGSGMFHRDLVRIDPNAPPRLNDNSAIGFDLEAGWATHHSNIHQKRDWFETVVQVAIVAAAAWATGGAAATWAAGAGYGATAGAVIAGAAAGATASAVSGAMNGNLSFKGILQGALSGAITGGLLQGEIGAAVGEMAGPAGTIVFRGTVQGGINALLGGSFKDGAIAGVASGLADLAGANLNKGIEDAVKAGTMSAAEAIAARSMARIFTSAVRALGSPGDPQYAFASDLVGSVVNDGLNATRNPGNPALPPALDDDGNLMPGIVDPGAPMATQHEQLAAHLQAQGLDAAQAELVAGQALLRTMPQLMPLVQQAVADPRTAGDRLVTDRSQDDALAEVNRELGIDPDGNPVMVPAGWRDDALAYIDKVTSRVGGALRSTLDDAMSAIRVGKLEQAQQAIAGYLDGVAARGGLSEAEIMALGVLYAANEALFPTTVLDLIPGGGKALGKVGDLLRAGNATARDVATAVRTESRALADAERAAQVNAAAAEARALAEGRTVIRETPGTKGDWNANLNGPLQSNATYVLANGHSYATDAAGRVTRAEGVLDVNKVDRNTWQQAAAGHVGGEGYDGGHLIATLFGGAGERINLVPQLATVNRGAYRAMEQEWAKAVLDGKAVKVEVSPIYSAGSQVPNTLEVRYWIDGKLFEREFPNLKPGG